MYFLNRRPRGFHYTYRFSNERKELLDELRRGVAPEVLAERSQEEAGQQPRRRRRSSSALSVWLAVAAFFMIVLLLLLLLF